MRDQITVHTIEDSKEVSNLQLRVPVDGRMYILTKIPVVAQATIDGLISIGTLLAEVKLRGMEVMLFMVVSLTTD